MHSWADLQSVHGFHCYDNVAPNAKCQRLRVLVLCLVIFVLKYFVNGTRCHHCHNHFRLMAIFQVNLGYPVPQLVLFSSEQKPLGCFYRPDALPFT